MTRVKGTPNKKEKSISEIYKNQLCKNSVYYSRGKITLEEKLRRNKLAKDEYMTAKNKLKDEFQEFLRKKALLEANKEEIISIDDIEHDTNKESKKDE